MLRRFVISLSALRSDGEDLGIVAQVYANQTLYLSRLDLGIVAQVYANQTLYLSRLGICHPVAWQLFSRCRQPGLSISRCPPVDLMRC